MQHDYLFDHSATAQLVMDPFGNRILAANIEASRLLDLDQVEIERLTVSELFAPSFPDLLVFTEEVIHRGRGRCDHLLVHNRQRDLRIIMESRCTADAGRPDDGIHILSSMQIADEAERQRAQYDARKHFRSGIGHWNRIDRIFHEFERENHLILEAAGEGIYGVDTNGITTFVNPAAERILGYSRQDLAGKNMHRMVHHSHGDGSHFEIKNCPIFEAFRDGKVHRVEDDIFWSKFGKPIDVEYTSTPILDNGSIVGAVVIFRDVSQKKSDRKNLLLALQEVEKLKNRLQLENAYLQEQIDSNFNHHHIIGKSAAIQNTLRQIKLVAPTEATVLICGESGTGKELIARAIHDMSERSNRSLIRVNCAAIPDELFESEFFGHTKGAFTGATIDRTGRFELADGGTLFLDEVAEIPLHLQGKLLRVLQEQQFEKVGSSRTCNVNVRIIAATNQDLKKLVAQGRFREDLFFRLNVFPIESVPLRARRDDIPLLTQHFLERASQRAKRSGLKIQLSQMENLKSYHWPGNIRELENVIERQVILARDGLLRFDDLASASPEPNSPPSINSSAVLTENEVKEIDRRNLLAAMEKCSGKVSGKGGAAELLGIKPTTVASRLKKYSIDPAIWRNS
jgi:PAS domain S-box-containing protein